MHSFGLYFAGEIAEVDVVIGEGGATGADFAFEGLGSGEKVGGEFASINFDGVGFGPEILFVGGEVGLVFDLGEVGFEVGVVPPRFLVFPLFVKLVHEYILR